MSAGSRRSTGPGIWLADGGGSGTVVLEILVPAQALAQAVRAFTAAMLGMPLDSTLHARRMHLVASTALFL